MNGWDADGRAWSWVALGAGAGLGALGGLTYGLGYQTVSMLKGNKFNGKDVIGSTIGGAVVGGIIGATAGALTGDPSALIAGTTMLGTGVVTAGAGVAGGMIHATISAPDSTSESNQANGNNSKQDTNQKDGWWNPEWQETQKEDKN